MEDLVKASAELEAFHPSLQGIQDQIEGLFNGGDLSGIWLRGVDLSLVTEAVIEIAYKLNLLAGVKYYLGETGAARRISQAAILFYRSVLVARSRGD